MQEPNFSESQLQQAVNTALIFYIFNITNQLLFPFVPSLFHERDLGWDTAFYIPWLYYPPNDTHDGCNFFIQYKLSVKLTSRGAKEWRFWNTAYFRFKIPHNKNDYHQWHCLRQLADNNYPTFYATNSILSKEELIKEYNSGTLLDVKNIPLLDIRDVVTLHKFVTFTSTSHCFLLHSERIEVGKISLTEVVKRLFKRLSNETPESLENANERLLEILNELNQDDENWQADLRTIYQIKDQLRPQFLWYVISRFIHKHIGANIFWLPTTSR